MIEYLGSKRSLIPAILDAASRIPDAKTVIDPLSGLWGSAAHVTTIENDSKRYVGTQIGIYDPQGRKVGKVSHLRNKGFVSIASREGVTPPSLAPARWTQSAKVAATT